MIVVILIELDNEPGVLIITIEIRAQKYGLFFVLSSVSSVGTKV